MGGGGMGDVRGTGGGVTTVYSWKHKLCSLFVLFYKTPKLSAQGRGKGKGG